MHACWILLCMSLNLVSYAFLLIKEGIGKSTKSKGGIEGSMPRPVGRWGCYRGNVFNLFRGEISFLIKI
jgi:hypothetical protein